MIHGITHHGGSPKHLKWILAKQDVFALVSSGIPETPAPLLQFMSEVHSFYVQQRSLMKPVVVHCK